MPGRKRSGTGTFRWSGSCWTRRVLPAVFYAVHPKRPDVALSLLGLERPYYQVFAHRFGFTPNLSVLDLLFNEGPDSILWLKKL